MAMLGDVDPAESQEWIEALDSVLAFVGAQRAFHLLDEVVAEARRKAAPAPYSATTPYLNTILPDEADRQNPSRSSGPCSRASRRGAARGSSPAARRWSRGPAARARRSPTARPRRT